MGKVEEEEKGGSKGGFQGGGRGKQAFNKVEVECIIHYGMDYTQVFIQVAKLDTILVVA